MTAIRLSELAKRGPLSRSTLYAEIAAGRLVARKLAGRTVVLDDDWRRYLESAPIVKTKGR